MNLVATVRRIRACEGEVAAQLLLESLIAELTRGLARYELVRTLNPRQFAELHAANLVGPRAFDDIVDLAVIERRG